MRSVTFSKTLDVFEFCSDSLKKQLEQGRQLEAHLMEEEERIRNEAGKQDVEMTDPNEESKEQKPQLTGQAAKVAMKQEQIKAYDEKLYRPHGQGMYTGTYELIGVVTHKGRSAEGGHYIGWVHASGDDWIKCDDETVTVVKTEDILGLKGGGDWHTAYLNLYRKIEVRKA